METNWRKKTEKRLENLFKEIIRGTLEEEYL